MAKKTNYLTEDARKIREEVFMVEQGFVQEFDDVDVHASHLVLYVADEPAAVCRYYAGEEEGMFWLGRIAVQKRFRARHIGGRLLLEAEEEIRKDGGRCIQLSAQVRVKGFYEKYGYEAVGEIYMDEGCPHICMRKAL